VDGTSELLPSKVDRTRSRRVTCCSPTPGAAAACGDPYDREIERVVFDVASGPRDDQGALVVRRGHQRRPHGRREGHGEAAREAAARARPVKLFDAFRVVEETQERCQRRRACRAPGGPKFSHRGDAAQGDGPA